MYSGTELTAAQRAKLTGKSEIEPEDRVSAFRMPAVENIDNAPSLVSGLDDPVLAERLQERAFGYIECPLPSFDSFPFAPLVRELNRSSSFGIVIGGSIDQVVEEFEAKLRDSDPAVDDPRGLERWAQSLHGDMCAVSAFGCDNEVELNVQNGDFPENYLAHLDLKNQTKGIPVDSRPQFKFLRTDDREYGTQVARPCDMNREEWIDYLRAYHQLRSNAAGIPPAQLLTNPSYQRLYNIQRSAPFLKPGVEYHEIAVGGGVFMRVATSPLDLTATPHLGNAKNHGKQGMTVAISVNQDISD